jgi:hypothetical protein
VVVLPTSGNQDASAPCPDGDMVKATQLAVPENGTFFLVVAYDATTHTACAVATARDNTFHVIVQLEDCETTIVGAVCTPLSPTTADVVKSPNSPRQAWVSIRVRTALISAAAIVTNGKNAWPFGINPTDGLPQLGLGNGPLLVGDGAFRP